jgi:hypothetical protein
MSAVEDKMWRPWMFLGVLPLLLLVAATYFVFVTPVAQGPSTKIESILDNGAKELEKHIDQQLDTLNAPSSSANNPQARNDERTKSIASPPSAAKEREELSDEQLEALFGLGSGPEELGKLSEKQLEALLSKSPSPEDMQRLSDEELAAMVALKRLAEETLLERKRGGKKP